MRARLAASTGATFRSLRTRNFRLFFVGQLISQTGTWMQSVAIVWVVLQLSDSGVALGLAMAAQFLPVLVFGAWGGVVADRVDRHHFLLITQSAFAVVALTFTVLSFTDLLTLPVIYLLSTAFGLVTALDNPARRALVVEMVNPADVANAVGLNSALMTSSRVLGPMLAGILIVSVGASWCFAVNALSFGAVFWALLAMDRSALRSAPRVERGKGQLREGLRYVWRTPELRLPLILLAAIGTLAFEFQVTLPLLAERTFGGDAGTFTLLYSAMSAGSVLGALLMARRTEVDTNFLVHAALGMGAFMTALALAPTDWFALLAVVPVGLTAILLIAGANAVIQLQAEPTMRGRALALTAVVFLGSTPIGGPIAGAVAELFGARAGIALGAVACLLAALWTRRQLARLQAPVAAPGEVHVAAEVAPS